MAILRNTYNIDVFGYLSGEHRIKGFIIFILYVAFTCINEIRERMINVFNLNGISIIIFNKVLCVSMHLCNRFEYTNALGSKPSLVKQSAIISMDLQKLWNGPSDLIESAPKT